MSTPSDVTTERTWQGSAQLERFLRPIETLRLDPDNARVHPERSITALGHALARFGQQKPIVALDGVVIAGNGTTLAAQQLGWTHIAVVDFEGTPTDALGYKIADNRTPELSHWNDELLAATLAQFANEDPESLESMGFTKKEALAVLKRAEAKLGEQKPDQVPQARMVFSVVFETAEDWRAWDEFVRGLFNVYPDIAHPSDRVIEHIRERVLRA
jgi:hypothetical protein